MGVYGTQKLPCSELSSAHLAGCRSNVVRSHFTAGPTSEDNSNSSLLGPITCPATCSWEYWQRQVWVPSNGAVLNPLGKRLPVGLCGGHKCNCDNGIVSLRERTN